MKIQCQQCDAVWEIADEEITEDLKCPSCEGSLFQVEDEKSGFSIRQLLRDVTPTFGSAAFHCTALLICALVSCERGGGEGPSIVAEIGELPTETLTEGEEESLDAEAVEEAVDESTEMLLEVEVVSMQPDSASTASTALDQTLSQLMPSGASGGGSLSELGSVGGGSGALGEGVSFMGVKAYGNRICVIADSSGSMMGSKLQYVKEEILETVRSLRKPKRFQLIFFNGRARPYPQQGWRDPQRDLPSLQQFLDSVQSFGGTEPITAFHEAFLLEPRPDIIYFMTDGQFDASVVAQVKNMNQGNPKVQIHAISFIDRSAAAQMQQIANDSGGTYNHVAGF